MKYTYHIREIDKRKLARAAGYVNDETASHLAKDIDTAVDVRLLDRDPEIQKMYDAKLGAVSYYGPDTGIGYRLIYVADMLAEVGVTLEIDWEAR